MKALATVSFLLAFAATPALAELKAGDAAPDFTAEAAKAGQAFTFSMADAREKGPVVLYFYPAAFTPGCTQEAHDFAEAVDDFEAMDATIIGVSADDIETLKKFSVSECKGEFPVAADEDGSVIKAYDAALEARPEIASRTSYVIAPDGEILLAHEDMNPSTHVQMTKDAVKKWHDSH